LSSKNEIEFQFLFTDTRLMRQEKNEDFLLKGLIRKIYGDKNITLKIFYSFTIWYGKVLSNNFYIDL